MIRYIFSLAFTWIALGIASAAIAGHVFKWQILSAWQMDSAATPMALSTATSIIMLSLAILLRPRKKRHTLHDIDREPTTIA